ncbi:MAG: ATP-binding cassette domain-containing protein [Synergistaceae bacterium]|jgi:ABC-2 type transport system ATP-binding protein|nr:ATP-binding cassette domain-containing protein [Synergistaceae bacterium]
MIELENIGKTFVSGGKKIQALKNVTASIEVGKLTGLIGPDGAGKTTFLRLICGLLVPSAGRVSVLGLNPATARETREKVGYMPQRFGLYEDLTVLENLHLHADLRGVPRGERKERYGKLLAFTSLEPFTDRLAGRLSGGMKQKLGLACTLLSRPPVLLLDEPGVGVDPVARRELWRITRGLLTPERAVIWSTSYLDEAGICDTVLLLNEGELVYSGSPKDLTERARGHVFLIDGIGEKRRWLIVPFLEMEQTLDAVIQGSRARVVVRDNGEELKAKLLSQRLGLALSASPAKPRFEDVFMSILGGARPPAGVNFFKSKDGTADPMVEARNLTKRFGGFTAVDDISFSIGRGEIFGLLGPNGAGKSTTFKMMCGLLRPTSGDCSIAGAKIAKAAARSRLGYMAQKFSLYEDLSVWQNLDFFSGVYGLTGARKKEAVTRAGEAFGLYPHFSAPARSLPLGFKQRLALACAVMHGPDALFLDEPSSGVDPVTRREFWTYINEAALGGVTVMVTTHFMDEAEYCDRIALIYQGKVAALGAPDDLKASAVDERNPDPTLEDAFIKWIERADAGWAGLPPT